MNIEKTREGNTLELRLEGWLDTDAAPLLADEVNALDESVTALVIDCSTLEFISSAGLRQIVAAHKAMDGALTLRNVSDEVLSIIQMTGLAKRLNIEA